MYNFFLNYGYINFGVVLVIKVRLLVERKKVKVVIVGVGFVGFGVVRYLMVFGYEVIVLEGR